MGTTPDERVRAAYGFDFPAEFFRFREFLAELPPGLLGEACEMSPAFPFQLADGKAPKKLRERPLWQDRYYQDLPEFLTIFTGTTDGLHWGYVFDAPGELEPVVAHYWHSDTMEHAIDGDSLFEAVRFQIEQVECGTLENIEYDPVEEGAYREDLAKLAVLRERLAPHWGGDRPETGDDYLEAYNGLTVRKTVASTWDRLGIVVPQSLYLAISLDPTRRPGFHDVEPKRPQVRAAVAESLALLDAGKPGAALKLGRDLWGWASEFPECYDLLDRAYAALGREPLRRMLSEARAWRERCDAARGGGK